MDIEKVVTALKVIDLARHWPELRSIHDLAMTSLKKEAELAKEELDKIAKEAAEKEAKEKEKAAADAKAAVEKEEKANAVPPAKEKYTGEK